MLLVDDQPLAAEDSTATFPAEVDVLFSNLSKVLPSLAVSTGFVRKSTGSYS